jgi:hypothetical protein
MSFKLRITPSFDQIAKRAKHNSSIRKLEDACDEAVFQFVNNPKPDREKILDGSLAKAEEAMQFHIREINKLDSKADLDPTEEVASLIKKSKDKISNPDEIHKIKIKLNKEVVDSINIMADTMSKSAKKISESFIGRLAADIPLPEASKLRKKSPLDHQATRSFLTTPTPQEAAGEIFPRNGGYIGNKPPDPIQLELLKTQKAILHHLQNQERLPIPATPKKKKAGKKRTNRARKEFCDPRFKDWVMWGDTYIKGTDTYDEDKRQRNLDPKKDYHLQDITEDFKASHAYECLMDELVAEELQEPSKRTWIDIKRPILKKLKIKIKQGAYPKN